MARFEFPEWTETLKKWINLLVLGAPVYLIVLIAYGVTPEAIRIGYQPDQPVPYSHALHAGELGIDCRYCHTTVERAGKAAVPPATTCMNCHSQVKKDSDLLAPVRAAFAENEPVAWTRKNHDGRVFYTSLGGPDDFKKKVFQTMLVNAIFWTAERKPTT